MVRVKGQKEEIMESVAMLIIFILSVFAIASNIIPGGWTGTEVESYSVASGIAYSMSGLSLVDQGSITRFLNGEHDLEIGLMGKDSGGPLRNYYVQAAAYREGGLLGPAVNVNFTGNVKPAKDPLENVSYIKFVKLPGEDVEIMKIDKNKFTDVKCTEPTPEQIKVYIDTYASEEEKKWVKAVIMAESRFKHCVGSHVEAFGLMQLLPSTARDHLHISNWYEAEQNVEGGISYLRELASRYEGHNDKYILAIANYNCNKILTLVRENCWDKGVYTNCWDKEIKWRTYSEYCQGTYRRETYNHIENMIKPCVDYYEVNPDCYNAPGEYGCPESRMCGDW